ncbi:MAG: methyltransferase domain-containing protein [Halioglobus sp.]|nr:methyltransferase domain-containing protein [Halioglobus sp.]
MPSFRSINLALSAGLHWRLPKQFTYPLALAYEQTIMELGASLDSGLMLDVGAGLSTVANKSLGLNGAIGIIGMDIAEDALHTNTDLDYQLVADACKTWPLADASLDMIVSRSVIEHLADTGTFARECRRVLKPGGFGVHLMPGRNAPFAILNRLLPGSISRRLLDWIFPEKKELLGFPAYYQNCTFPEIVRLFGDAGLTVERVYCRYYQSTYYAAFFPAYLAFVAYDLVVWKLGIKRLSSQLMIVISRDSSAN